jgi:hypothetical protein
MKKKVDNSLFYVAALCCIFMLMMILPAFILWGGAAAWIAFFVAFGMGFVSCAIYDILSEP